MWHALLLLLLLHYLLLHFLPRSGGSRFPLFQATSVRIWVRFYKKNQSRNAKSGAATSHPVGSSLPASPSHSRMRRRGRRGTEVRSLLLLLVLVSPAFCLGLRMTLTGESHVQKSPPAGSQLLRLAPDFSALPVRRLSAANITLASIFMPVDESTDLQHQLAYIKSFTLRCHAQRSWASGGTGSAEGHLL
jgi:hypothetical protein